MTGLDKILAQIQLDTDNICADINNRAQALCADIINSAHKEAQIIKIKGDEQAKSKKEDIIYRAKSTASLQKNAVMLSTKQEIIASAVACAKSYLCNLPVAEYFELLIRMIEKYSEDSNGEMLLSSKDLQRIPSDFQIKISACSKGKLIVSEDTVDIDGGFVLKYGGVEVNCAFESIFSAESEKLSDTVSHILFA